MAITASFQVTLTLPVEWVNKVLSSLAKEPYIEVADPLHEIRQQAEFQIKSYELEQDQKKIDQKII